MLMAVVLSNCGITGGLSNVVFAESIDNGAEAADKMQKKQVKICMKMEVAVTLHRTKKRTVDFHIKVKKICRVC